MFAPLLYQAVINAALSYKIPFVISHALYLCDCRDISSCILHL